MRRHLLVIAAAGALGLAEITTAQMNFIGPRLSGRAFVPQIELQQRRGDQQTESSSQRSSSTPAPNADRALVYTPSAARRKVNLASFVERSRGSPETAASLRQMLASVDVIGEMQRAIEPVGLSVSNVADAYAVWWMSSWGAAHGDPTTPNRATAQAVRAQAARAIMALPEFGRADDAAKQEYAEAMLVQAAMIDGLLERYRTDPVMGPKVAASARQGARASGLDLDAMTLTENGFVAVNPPQHE